MVLPLEVVVVGSGTDVAAEVGAAREAPPPEVVSEERDVVGAKVDEVVVAAEVEGAEVTPDMISGETT